MNRAVKLSPVSKQTVVGFVGFGRMGSALAMGAVAAGVLKPAQLVACDPETKAQQQIRRAGAKLAKDAAEVVLKSQIVFICVKPQMMSEALKSVDAGFIAKNKCFVSIAAGVPISKLQQWLGSEASVIRVMPNTPALLGAGMSALCQGRYATKPQMSVVSKILGAVGEVAAVPEEWMDAVTAVSGSGPAYVFYLTEALIAGGVKEGLPPDIAEKLARQTVYGAGLMLAKRSEAAEELRRQVTSPGGTTAAAVASFDRDRLKEKICQAVSCAAKRSAELAK